MQSALLIVGQGSKVNPDSSAPTLAHAAEIRHRVLFPSLLQGSGKCPPVL